MGRITRLFSNCFGRRKVVCEFEDDDVPMVAERPSLKKRSGPKRPPRFPQDTQNERPSALRPKSPFDKRLKRIGQRIEAEVRKEYCSSQHSSQVGDVASSECPSWNSNYLLNSTDSLNPAALSYPSIDVQHEDIRSIAFPSLEALEADCYRTLIEEQNCPSSPVGCRSCSSSASSCSMSSRDYRQYPYLFYEEEEDVVMEFLPTLPDMVRAC